VTLHALNGCLLYYLFILLKCNRKYALVAAIIFTVHPALATAVSWIGGRNDTLMTFWVVLSFITLVRYRLTSKLMWALSGLLAWGLAVFTKEPALLFPAAGIVYLLSQGEKGRKLATMLAGWSVLGLVFLAARWNVARPGYNTEVLFLNNATQNINGFLSYIAKAFLPIRLSVYAGYDPAFFWLGALVLVALTGLIWYTGIRDKRLFLLGAGWFLLFLLPYAWRSVDYPNFLEHRLYLPGVGLAMMMLSLRPVIELKGRNEWLVWPVPVLLLSAVTVNRLPVFTNGMTFWNDAARYSSGLYCVHDMLGKVYYERGQWDKAGEHFRRTLELKSDYTYGLNNLGMFFLQQGQSDSAVIYFKMALAQKPDYSEAWANLGSVYLQTGEVGRAENSFRKALGADSLNATACNGLGMVFAGRDSLAMAENWYRQSLRLDPLNSGPVWFNLGKLYAGHQKLEPAVTAFKEAARLDPENPAPRKELGILYLRQRNPAAAVAELNMALKLEPNDPMTNNYMALAYFGVKDIHQAYAYYRKAVELGLKPDPRVWRMIIQSQ
jgi:tetratricopeptide (TPR) repeat protein